MIGSLTTSFSVWRLAGWTMLHFLWVGSLIVVVTALGSRLLRHSHPDVRYACALASLTVLAAAPVAIAARLVTCSYAVDVIVGALAMERAWSTERLKPDVPLSPSFVLEPPTRSTGTKAALTAAGTVVRGLRWMTVLVLVYYPLDTLVFVALGPEAQALRPSQLGVLQELVSMVLFYTIRLLAIIAPSAIIAPRFRCATALIFAALYVPISFWGHIFAVGGPWWFWTISYTHVTLETLGAMIGVAYIVWLEKSQGSEKSIPHVSPPAS